MTVHNADIDAYFEWLRERTKLRDLSSGWTEITTPYLDRHNDYIQIYGRRHNGAIELTDDGYTINDLENSGCELKTGKRKALLEGAARGHGVDLSGRELVVRADDRNFSLKAHSLVQSILAVNDLFYLSRSHVASLFLEDVTEWLNSKDIRYTPGVKLAGKSGFDHYYDFIIPRSARAPERLVTAVNRPSRQSASNHIFAWLDTSEVRATGTEAITIINDQEQKGVTDFTSAVGQYNIVAVPWSERERYVDRLAA